MSWIRIGGVYQLAKDEKTCSNPIIKVLDEHFLNDQDTVISSNFRRTDLTMVCEFLNKGSLPFPETDVSNGVIPEEVIKLFFCFGIDLNFILKSLMLKSEDKELDVEHVKLENEFEETLPNHLDGDTSKQHTNDVVVESEDTNYEVGSESEAQSDDSEGERKTKRPKVSRLKSLTT